MLKYPDSDMNMDFRLRYCVKDNRSEVRVLKSVVSSEGSFLSEATDSTVCLWNARNDGYEFEEQKLLTSSGHPVSALCLLPTTDSEQLGLVAVASSNDHIIRIFGIEDNNPLYQLEGHADTVNALVAGKFSLVSGSSDHTARLWVKDRCVKTLQGHEGAVWGVALMTDRAYTFTASQDKTIKMWKAGKCERVFHGHTAGVRCVVVLNSVEIMSCSDDGTIRRWNTSDGSCTQTCGSHTTAILSVALLSGGSDFVCCTADHMLQIWREQTLKQTIALPQTSLPVMCVLSNGDIVTSGSNGMICIFTSDVSRMASKENQEAFQKSFGSLNTDSTSATAEPCLSVTSKPVYQDKEYDFVFDIELHKDRPPLKLPYNVGDDLQLAAHNFLQQNSVDERFLETVMNYIRSHIGSPASPAAAATVTDVSTGAVSKTKSSASKDRYFPETTFLSYEQCNLQQMFDKIREFNKFAVNRGGEEFSEDNISLVERLVKDNEHCSDAVAVLWQMLQWPSPLLFPVLDVLRLVVLQPQSNKHFANCDQFLDYACTQLSCRSNPKNQLVMLRVLCNMFKCTSGERFVTKHSERLLSTVLSELANSAEKYIEVTLSTFVLNLTTASCCVGDSEGTQRCLDAAIQLTQTQSDSEAHFRLLVSIGTAMSRDHHEEARLVAGESLDLENFLHWCRVDGPDKTRCCSQQLAELLASHH